MLNLGISMTKKSQKNTKILHLLGFWLVDAFVFSIFGSLMIFPCHVSVVAGGNQLSGLVSLAKLT